MGLFDFLKSREQEIPQKDDTGITADPDVQRFEEEFLATIPRYYSKPGIPVDLRMRNSETDEIMSFAAAFPEQYDTWKTVRSLADRRGILYSIYDNFLGKQLELWQVIERYNDDRYALKALEMSEQAKEKDVAAANYWNALARTHFILSNNDIALKCCEKANELEPENIRTTRVQADILHTSGRHTEAHELYNRILAVRLPTDKEMSMHLYNLLGFDGDLVNSPVYAVAWLREDKEVTTEHWEWANEEFYYSPYFRSQYAFFLIEKKEHLKGFAKLKALSDEMPWYYDAVVNTYNLIDQLQLTGQMQKEKERLGKIIQEKGW
ncbi:tetratricopeptide repeat protein [Chitinophagaceae bacterium MMS25-I14]